jgi:hypothetical protein
MQEGLGVSRLIPVAVGTPVVGSTRKLVTLPEDWLAT